MTDDAKGKKIRVSIIIYARSQSHFFWICLWKWSSQWDEFSHATDFYRANSFVKSMIYAEAKFSQPQRRQTMGIWCIKNWVSHLCDRFSTTRESEISCFRPQKALMNFFGPFAPRQVWWPGHRSLMPQEKQQIIESANWNSIYFSLNLFDTASRCCWLFV